MRERKRGGERIGARLTWNVSSEQKLITLPRRRGTMCCPAACESSQTDLRFTFRTCWRQCGVALRSSGMKEGREGGRDARWGGVRCGFGGGLRYGCG